MVEASERVKPPVVARPLEEVRQVRGHTKTAVNRPKVASLRAFRRVGSDRFFGALGAVFVAAALVLIFTWDNTPAPEPKVALAWKEEAKKPSEQNQTVTENQPIRVFTFEIQDPNVTQVRLSAFWIDDVASEMADWDLLSIRLEGPPGTNVIREEIDVAWTFDWGANVTFPIRVQDPPEAPSQFSVGTEAEARQLLGDRTQRVGTGEWKVTVTLNEARSHYENDLVRGQPCPDGSAPQVCTPDRGNWVRVSLQYATYYAEFKLVV